MTTPRVPTGRNIHVEVEVVSSCPSCGSTRLRHWGACRDRLHRLSEQEFNYSRCRGCGLLFLVERPIAADAGKLYPDDYAPYVASARDASDADTDTDTGRTAAASDEEPIVAGTAKSRLARAATRVLPDRLPRELAAVYRPRPPSVLVDYGCGGPAFLDGARRRGWHHTIGVDMNPVVVDRVTAAGHSGVLAADFARDVADHSVAVVRMNHVLEHLYDPLDVLGAIRAKLAPGGVLHVAVPNGRSLWAALSRSFWFNADPRHLVQYGPEHLRSLADLAGFADVRIVHEVITRDMARTIGYVREHRGSVAHDEVEGLARDVRLARLLDLPARLSAAVGRGDRFHALLRS